MRALTGLTIIDGKGDQPIKNGSVVIDGDGRIQSVGKEGAFDLPRDIELEHYGGKTIMPGLIDAHVHLTLMAGPDPNLLLSQRDGQIAMNALGNAKKTLQCGVTTVRDLGGFNYVDLDVRDFIAKGFDTGPTMLASGKVVTMTGGHGWLMGEEVDGVDEARKGTRKQLREGVDLIKIMATGGVMTEGVEPGSPQLTEEEMRAAIEEAHKADRKTSNPCPGYNRD